MPRTPVLDKPDPIVAPAPAMISSAARIIGNGTGLYRKTEEWQDRCWHYRNNLGEVRYAAEWFANALSRALISPARYDADGTLVPIKVGPEVDELRSILGGMGNSGQSLKAIGEHLFVVGECYMLGRSPITDEEKEADEDIVWEVVSSDKVKKRGKKWVIDYGEGDKYDVKDSDDLFRVHKPHPQNVRAADSPLRAVLPSLFEIEMLSMHVLAQIRSRLAGAGILFISDQMSFAAPQGDAEGTNLAEGLDPLMKALATAAVTAIQNPDDPTALLPIIARVAAGEVDNQNLMHFWSPLDEQTIPMRNDAIRRTALGIDLPPEVLLGTADVNHWGAWQIEESTIKAHIEPALEIIAAALTRILRSTLDDPTIVCIFDTSALRLRPNRSKEAFELWDRGEIDAEALRRETGFSEADDPDDKERQDWYLRKVASGSASPAMVEAALRLLGIDFPVTDDGNNMRESRPDPSLEDHPEVGPPPQMSQAASDARRASLEATCDAVVHRALERAGNRLRNNTTVRPEGVEPDEMHLFVKARTGQMDSLLDGAWSCLPKLLRGQPHSHEAVSRALDAYTRSLLDGQQQHDPDTMMRFVDAGISAAA
jgi:hypothetical protein